MLVQQKVEGDVSPCPGTKCGGKQPMFFLNSGNNCVHAECPLCRITLWECGSLQEAIEVWELLPR